MAMKAEYINPFIVAAQSVINTACNEQMTIGKLSVKSNPIMTSDVVTLIGITGKVEGQVIFSFSEEVARSIASKMMMGAEVPVLNDIAKSAICELTNMILGNTATAFYEQGTIVDITPPSLLIGKDISVSTVKGDFVSIPLQFVTTGETFEIDVFLIDKED